MNNINFLRNGICHFEEIILNNLIVEDKQIAKSKINEVCKNLEQFLDRNVPAGKSLNFKKIIQKIIVSDENHLEKRVGKLFSKLNDLKNECIEEKVLPSKLQSLEDYRLKLREIDVQMSAVARIRRNLATMKAVTTDIVDQRILNKTTALKYSIHFGRNFNAILQDIFMHAVKKLEMQLVEGPDLVDWSVVVLGSLAREEGHPYSDIDFLIIADSKLENDEKANHYFKLLMQEIADLIHQIGEESNGFKLCGGNLTPPYLPYNHRYAHDGMKSRSVGGMGSFLTTPERLALTVYQSAVSFLPLKGHYNLFKAPLTGNENLIGAALLDAAPIFGNSTLFDRFKEAKNQLGQLKITQLFDASHLEGDDVFGEDATTEQLAYRSILGSLTQKRSSKDYDRKKLNVKKDFMRPIQMGISVLANQFGIKENNTIQRLDVLAQMKILSKADAEAIKTVYLQLYQMRIEESTWFKGENDDVFLEKEAFVAVEEQFNAMSKELATLNMQEQELISTRINGREGMEELIRIRDLQEAYEAECAHLFKLIQNKKITNPLVLEYAKIISRGALDKINQYIQQNCNKVELDLI